MIKKHLNNTDAILFQSPNLRIVLLMWRQYINCVLRRLSHDKPRAFRASAITLIWVRVKSCFSMELFTKTYLSVLLECLIPFLACQLYSKQPCLLDPTFQTITVVTKIVRGYRIKVALYPSKPMNYLVIYHVQIAMSLMNLLTSE